MTESPIVETLKDMLRRAQALKSEIREVAEVEHRDHRGAMHALAGRVPDPNDLRLLLGAAEFVLKYHGEDRNTGLADAAARVRASLGTEEQA